VLYVCVFSSSSVIRVQAGPKFLNNSSTVILQGKLTREWTETESERASEQEQVRERARARARGRERKRKSAREREGKSEREREEDRWAERARQIKEGKCTSGCERERERERDSVNFYRVGVSCFRFIFGSGFKFCCACVAVCCRVLQGVAVCCSMLQCVAVCCSVRVYVYKWRAPRILDSKCAAGLTCVAPVLQCDAV